MADLTPQEKFEVRARALFDIDGIDDETVAGTVAALFYDAAVDGLPFPEAWEIVRRMDEERGA